MLRGAALIDRLHAIPFLERDAWLDAMLGLDEAPPDVAELPRGSVPYLPCAVDEIVAMVRDAPLGPSDELVDLGSGLGRVAMLAHLLSGARATGIEVQAPLVDRARARCDALSLPISFVLANVTDVELEGSVFFLYAPFTGDTLVATCARLVALGQRRPITVCAVGVELPWLTSFRSRAGSSASLTLYDSPGGARTPLVQR